MKININLAFKLDQHELFMNPEKVNFDDFKVNVKTEKQEPMIIGALAHIKGKDLKLKGKRSRDKICIQCRKPYHDDVRTNTSTNCQDCRNKKPAVPPLYQKNHRNQLKRH